MCAHKGSTCSIADIHSVRWLQDTVSHLCAKFGQQRRTFNEISSWLSMNQKMVNHVSEKWLYILKMIKQRLGWVNRTSTKMIQWFSCVKLTPQSNSERAKQRDTSGHFRDIFIHEANRASGCCLSLQLKLVLGFWALLDGPACQGAWCIEEIFAIKPICGNSPGCDFWRWRSNYPCNFDDATPELHTEQQSIIGYTI